MKKTAPKLIKAALVILRAVQEIIRIFKPFSKE